MNENPNLSPGQLDSILHDTKTTTATLPASKETPLREKVRPLKTKWGANERNYEVLQREKDIVLVEAVSQHTGRISSYEVAIITIGGLHPRDTRTDGCDCAERYPSSEQWGKFAWTWTSKSIAQAHFAFLVKHGRLANFFSSPEYNSAKRELRSR